MNTNQPEAGPSRHRQVEPYRFPVTVPEHLFKDPNAEYITIPSIGLEYYKYRRALFLAGESPHPLPDPRPDFITVSKPPPPIPYTPRPSNIDGGRFRNQAAGMALLEKQLDKPRSKQNAFTKARVREVEEQMKSGKRLVAGTTLSFVIKILKYGWVDEGMWPIDPITREPVIPANSPIQSIPSLPDVGQEEGSASTATERF